MIFQYRKLWQSGEFVGECATLFSASCQQLIGQSPHYKWVIRKADIDGSTVYYNLTDVDPVDATALRGVWIEVASGGVLIDGTVEDVKKRCALCCDDVVVNDTENDSTDTVKPYYNGSFPIIPRYNYVARDNYPGLPKVTVNRLDGGDSHSFQKFQLAYMKIIEEGTLMRDSYIGGSSAYTFGYKKLPNVLIGADTYGAMEARSYFSNPIPAATATPKYRVILTINHNYYHEKDDLNNLAEIVADVLAAINAVPYSQITVVAVDGTTSSMVQVTTDTDVYDIKNLEIAIIKYKDS